MSNGAGFAIIDGKPLHPDTGQAIDGLTPQTRTVKKTTQQQSNISASIPKAPTHKKPPVRPVIDGLGGPRRQLPKQPRSNVKSKPSSPKPQQAPPQPQTEQNSQAGPVEPTTKENPTKTEKQLIQSRKLSERRAQRAQQYRQHHAISKFGAIKHQDRKQQADTTPTTPLYKPSEELATTAIARQVYQPQAAINKHLSDHDHTENPPEYEDNKPQQSLFSWLNPSSRAMKIATVTMSVLMLSAYVAYLNAPNISVRIAASRAGIEAQLPGYTPSGFTLSGPVEYEPGKIVISFGSNSDERQFTITEEESRWNSETLRENAVANISEDYETVQRGGLTIYIWNGSSASWVNQGIRYTLAGDDSQLSEQQITQIATSL